MSQTTAPTPSRASRLALPLKPGYGPTLGQLLSPGWRALPLAVRALLALGAAAILAGVLTLVLALLPKTFSHGGAVPFSFEYRHLRRQPPETGAYVRLVSLRDGRIEDSFQVLPLSLPPYNGELSGEVPLFATAYIRGVGRHYQDFHLEGEGETRVNTVPAYTFYFLADVQGREMYGRYVLLLPERPGVRSGVVIAMLTTPTADDEVKSPMEVATAGVLNRPLESFTLG